MGRQLGLLLYKMVILEKVKVKDIHLIGHSLGAHVAHYASIWLRHLSTRTGEYWIPGRITGLDPAAPRFQGHLGTHLVKKDADFVDVIHTATIGKGPLVYNLLRGRLGMSELLGSIDFFPNGGTTPQPACVKETVISRFFSFPCSHIEALMYFRASLFSNRRVRDRGEMVYPSVKCDSMKHLNICEENAHSRDPQNKTQDISTMGIQAINFNGRGRHYLRT